MQAICPAESAPNDGMMAKQPPFCGCGWPFPQSHAIIFRKRMHLRDFCAGLSPLPLQGRESQL